VRGPAGDLREAERLKKLGRRVAAAADGFIDDIGLLGRRIASRAAHHGRSETHKAPPNGPPVAIAAQSRKVDRRHQILHQNEPGPREGLGECFFVAPARKKRAVPIGDSHIPPVSASDSRVQSPREVVTQGDHDVPLGGRDRLGCVSSAPGMSAAAAPGVCRTNTHSLRPQFQCGAFTPPSRSSLISFSARLLHRGRVDRKTVPRRGTARRNCGLRVAVGLIWMELGRVALDAVIDSAEKSAGELSWALVLETRASGS